MDSFYTLPLDFEQLLKKKNHPRCSLKESIAQNVYLILTTNYRESRFASGYGCSIWEQDFELMTNIKWKDGIKNSIEESLPVYEPRLTNIKVKVELDEHEFGIKENKRIKRRLGISVEANIKKTNEKFEFYENIYISPISVD